ncbi:uncharacterized protein LOC121404683 [Drosophila obscura]|uniref:uncharacterized protein LOC121404683 n=1 Tax=Drosophila obscura TaxID=7282 RepID=UPI001BB1B8BF|nr:uncharacterized protein LOC121404683 [Drosophila obscura]
MADLPKDRVQDSPAFSVTGIDYCGPFYYKPDGRTRTPTKCYISVFICFETKAKVGPTQGCFDCQTPSSVTGDRSPNFLFRCDRKSVQTCLYSAREEKFKSVLKRPEIVPSAVKSKWIRFLSDRREFPSRNSEFFWTLCACAEEEGSGLERRPGTPPLRVKGITCESVTGWSLRSNSLRQSPPEPSALPKLPASEKRPAQNLMPSCAESISTAKVDHNLPRCTRWFKKEANPVLRLDRVV